MSLDPTFQAASEAAQSWPRTLARVAELGRRQDAGAVLAYWLLMPDTEGIGPAYKPPPPPPKGTPRSLTLRDSYQQHAGVLERMKDRLIGVTTGQVCWPHGRGGQPVAWSSAHEAALGLVGLAMETLVGPLAGVDMTNRGVLARHLVEARSQSLALPPQLVADLEERIRHERVNLIRQSQAEANTGDQPAAPTQAAAVSESRNVLELMGGVWHVRFQNEAGDFPDRQGSVLRHLARLLAEPNRRFGALEFYPPLPGAASLPHLGRDDTNDDQALKEYEKRLKQLAHDIKEAKSAHDVEEADRLQAEFNALAEHLGGEKGARNRGHKKRCGTLGPTEKADQALRVGLGKLQNRFRDKRLPNLANHLDKHIDNAGGEWWYMPPPGTSTWHVSRPEK